MSKLTLNLSNFDWMQINLLWKFYCNYSTYLTIAEVSFATIDIYFCYCFCVRTCNTIRKKFITVITFLCILFPYNAFTFSLIFQFPDKSFTIFLQHQPSTNLFYSYSIFILYFWYSISYTSLQNIINYIFLTVE